MLIYSVGRRVQLYVIDLNSANGTFVNNSRIEPQKYVQVLEKVRYVGYFFQRDYQSVSPVPVIGARA